MIRRHRTYGRHFGDPSPLTYADPRAMMRARRWRRLRRTARVVRWTSRRAWTHRRGWAPAYATAALATLGAVGHYTPHGAALVWSLWLWVGVAYGWWLTRRARRSLLRRWRLAYVAGAYLTAAAWLAAATAAGPAPAVRSMLAAWFVAAGAPWWWYHMVRHDKVVELRVDDREADWDAHVAGLVSGATMADLADLKDPEGHDGVIGWQADVQVPKGKKVQSLIAVSEEIAGVYDLEVSDIALERTTARTAKLSVYTKNPLRRIRHWPGPHLFDPETGVAKIATYADATPAMYRFYRRGSGPKHDLIAGTTEAGKSRLLDQLLSIERDSPFMASVVIDPQRGQSLPDWKDSCAVFARSVEEGCDVLLAVRDEMYRRNEILANIEWTDEKGRTRHGIDHFDPLTGPAADLGMPLICLTIEEAHAFKGTIAEPVIEDIAKMARKCGIKLRVVAQVPLLDQLPGSTTLRDMLVGGNVICFRTANKLTSQVSFNGIDLGDPSLLPREWPDGSTTSGLCYVLGAQPRAAVARSWLVDDPFHWATTGETTLLPELSEQVSMYRWTRTNGAENRPPVQAPAPMPKPAAKVGTIADRAIAWLAEQESDIATTGAVAAAIDEKLPSVTTALTRAADAGRVRNLGHAMWGRVETSKELAEVA